MMHGAWHVVCDARWSTGMECEVLGAWSVVRERDDRQWCVVCNARGKVRGAWYGVRGAKCMAHGAWRMACAT